MHSRSLLRWPHSRRSRCRWRQDTTRIAEQLCIRCERNSKKSRSSKAFLHPPPPPHPLPNSFIVCAGTRGSLPVCKIDVWSRRMHTSCPAQQQTVPTQRCSFPGGQSAAKVNAADKEGITALMLASARRHIEAIEALVAKGALSNAVSWALPPCLCQLKTISPAFGEGRC